MTFSFRFNIGLSRNRRRIYPRVKYIYVSFESVLSSIVRYDRYDRRERYFYIILDVVETNELDTKRTDD